MAKRIRFITDPPEFYAYAVGPHKASVCSSLTPRMTTVRLNHWYPPEVGVEVGTTKSKWKKSKAKLGTGETNPYQCHKYPKTHKHYIYTR